MKKTLLLAAILLISSVQLMARVYPDSVREASQAQARINQGLSIEVSGGIGMSRIDFQHWGQKGNNAFQANGLKNYLTFPSGNAALGLTYYFVPSFGLGTGIEFSSYRSETKINKPWTFNGVDKYGDEYYQTIRTDAVEQQDLYMLEIPVGLHFRAMGEGKRVGFIGALGIKFGLPMLSTYQMKNNAILENVVGYPIYDLEIRDIPTVIENGTIPAYRGSFGTIPSPNYRRSMSYFNYAGFAQVGALFQLSQRVDMSLTAFATYYINDVVDGRGNEAISFGAGLPVGEYPTPLSEERAENGLMNTNAVSSVHPWNVGLKVGFHFNTGKTEAQRAYDKEQRRLRREARLAAKLEPEPEPEIEVEVTPQVPVFVPTPVVIEPQTEDTVVEETSGCTDTIYIYIHDTIYIHDALPIVKTDAVAQITEEMEKSIIWFDLDSTVPILQPKDILINIAAILKAHPKQRVYVNGHACKLGKPDYNKRLALRRAQAVEKQLIELGVNADQLVVRTKGANEPFRFNGKHTLEKDRRVEIIPIEEEVTPVEDVKTAVAEATNVEQTTESSTNEEKVRSVVIKAGDRLSKFARQYYGDTEYWRIIYEANKDVITNPDRLPVGKTIVIP